MDFKITKTATRATSILSVAMLAVLILLSSCSIRKAFQNSLELPVTKPLNLNKAVVSDVGTCHIAQDESIPATKWAAPSVDAGMAILDNGWLQLLSLSSTTTVPALPVCEVDQQLPYYILYKQMRIFS